MALAVSAAQGTGLDEAWGAMRALHEHRRKGGALERRRRSQARGWFDDEVRRTLLARAMAEPGTRERLDALGRAVEEGRASPAAAAREALARVDSPGAAT